MRITSRLKDGILVVDLAGRIDSSAVVEFEDALSALQTSNAEPMLWNLAGVESIGSGGLRVCVTAAKRAEAQSRALRLCCVNAGLKTRFEIAGLLSSFEIRSSEEEALIELQSTRS